MSARIVVAEDKRKRKRALDEARIELTVARWRALLRLLATQGGFLLLFLFSERAAVWPVVITGAVSIALIYRLDAALKRLTTADTRLRRLERGVRRS